MKSGPVDAASDALELPGELPTYWQASACIGGGVFAVAEAAAPVDAAVGCRDDVVAAAAGHREARAVAVQRGARWEAAAARSGYHASQWTEVTSRNSIPRSAA